jgi:hypothetical protein
MRTNLAVVYETIKAHNKTLEAARATEATATISALAEAAKQQGRDVVVAHIDFGSDAKVVKKIQECFKAAHPDGSLFLVSFDGEAGQ